MVATATSLITSNWATSSLDSLTRKPTHRIKQRVASYHTTEVTAHRKPKKWLPWQRPSGAGYRQYLHSVGRPLKAPSITNYIVAIIHTKPVNSNFSPKIGCHGNVLQLDRPPSNTRFFGPTRVHIPKSISIGSAVFAGLAIATDRQTDRPRYSVCNDRPHLRT